MRNRALQLIAVIVLLETALLTPACTGSAPSFLPAVQQTQLDPDRAEFFLYPSTKLDDGVQGKVALNDHNVLVEVHKSQNEDTLWYHVGTINPGRKTISWGSSHKYATGVNPSVAIRSDGIVVGVHKSPNEDTLWYRVGSVNTANKTISWNDGIHYATGVHPSVAVSSDGTVVGVHKSPNEDTLWYRVGTVNAAKKTVSWTDGIHYATGVQPSVAMLSDGTTVVGVHKSPSHDTLWYRVGSVNAAKKTISWGTGIKYTEDGRDPSVALRGDGTVVEVHKSLKYDTLYYRVGVVNSVKKTIKWGSKIDYSIGRTPSVALNQGYVVQTHESQTLNAIWYSCALAFPHYRWMEELEPYITDKQLWEVTLPGTHDAGMYKADQERVDTPMSDFVWWFVKDWVSDNWVKTQTRSIYRQLVGGVRFLDLRPYWDGKDLWIYHGVRGPKTKDVFNDIKKFMDESARSNARELVVVQLANCRKLTGKNGYATLANQIKHYLGNYLYTTEDPANTNLLTSTIGALTQDGPRVLLLIKKGDYDKWKEKTDVPKGVWPFLGGADKGVINGRVRISNSYANTYDFDKMQKDQLKKLRDKNGSTEKKMFALSWTLTPPEDTGWWVGKYLESRLGTLAPEPRNLEEMSRPASRGLQDFLIAHGNKSSTESYNIGILYSDYYDKAGIVDFAVLRNRYGHW